VPETIHPLGTNVASTTTKPSRSGIGRCGQARSYLPRYLSPSAPLDFKKALADTGVSARQRDSLRYNATTGGKDKPHRPQAVLKSLFYHLKY
jgi:hypothetical protein